MNLSAQEKSILKELALQYMEYASLPVNRKKMELWKALNRSEMQRPMITIEQIPWHEIAAVDDSVVAQVKDPYWQDFETQLRRTIYKWEHFPVDMVLEPYLWIPQCITHPNYGIRGEGERITHEAGGVNSSHFVSQIDTYEDIEKIKDMDIIHDAEETKLRFSQAEEIFDGVAPIKLKHGIQFQISVWDALSQYMGVEDVYYALIDRPEFVHAVLERITEATMRGIEKVNELKLYNDSANIAHCSHIYTDELLPDFDAGKGSVTQNSWGWGQAQLFTSTSPAVTEEFEVPYVSKLAEKFGMMYYGCCERLDDRLEIVKKIPNVKKISCSPWSNKENFAEKIGKKIVMSNKPTPAYLATETFDEELIRNDLKETIACARKNGVNLEFLLKDISTVKGDPSRLDRWAELAMELVESY